MSLRKSLYKQYNKNTPSTSGSFINLAGADTEEKHWVRTWYDPPVPTSSDPTAAGQASVISANGLNGSLGLGRHSTPNQTSVLSTAQTSVINSHESTPQPGLSGADSIANGLDGSSTPQSLYKTYGFKIKTWVISEGSSHSKDCEDEEKDTIINLSNFKYGINEYAPKIDTESTEKDDNGLTEADIKSAVGGTDGGSSLFSSSAAQEMKEKKESAEQEDKSASTTTPSASSADAITTNEDVTNSVTAEPTPATITAETASPIVEENKNDNIPTADTEVQKKETDGDGDVEMKE